MEYILYMFVDQNSFARERPFFANKNVTPYLSFAEPMFSKAIMISNFRETSAKKNVTFANSKQTFARVSNITCTVFAVKTVYKDL